MTRTKRVHSDHLGDIETQATNAAIHNPGELDRDPMIGSKRAKRIAKVVGDVGCDGNPKGIIRYDNLGSLEYWNPKSVRWEPAVFHEELREELIRDAGWQGYYDHARAQGIRHLDVTSFHAAQKTWGSERENRPDVLFRVYQLDYPVPHYDGRIWYHGDESRVVLDGDHHPVRDFAEIPAVCSSEMEGWLMEAIRRINPKITHKDFRARMPHYRSISDSGEGLKSMYSLTAIGMRMTRFRARAGCIAWERRAGSDTVQQYLERLLPPLCLAVNSTRGFRDLTSDEILGMKDGNKGKFPERAGDRPASSRTRKPKGASITNCSKTKQNDENASVKPDNKRKRTTSEIENEHTPNGWQPHQRFKRRKESTNQAHSVGFATTGRSFDQNKHGDENFNKVAVGSVRVPESPTGYVAFAAGDSLFQNQYKTERFFGIQQQPNSLDEPRPQGYRSSGCDLSQNNAPMVLMDDEFDVELEADVDRWLETENERLNAPQHGTVQASATNAAHMGLAQELSDRRFPNLGPSTVSSQGDDVAAYTSSSTVYFDTVQGRQSHTPDWGLDWDLYRFSASAEHTGNGMAVAQLDPANSAPPPDPLALADNQDLTAQSPTPIFSGDAPEHYEQNPNNYYGTFWDASYFENSGLSMGDEFGRSYNT